MIGKKKLPIGVDDFEKLIRQEFYYADKTKMIAELLYNWGEVNLFTRPRRFGKSLNMSMLKAFFEIETDRTLFEGLDILKEPELCEKYMGRFPVISITLKNIEGSSYEAAKKLLKDTIGTEARRFSFLSESEQLTEEEIESYKALTRVEDDGSFKMSDTALEKSLFRLTELLRKHYDKQVILIIDEYDVPLDKAFQYGYYEEMVSLLRNIFGNVLKTNSNLYFAVLTGCLRVAKESIFTGLNNFNVLSITNVEFDEYFGLTDQDVKKMLEYYELEKHYDTIKEWYNGYQFGKTSVYCPWDVISYCKNLRADSQSLPEDYWSNTSSNSIVRRMLEKANKQTKDEIEQLIAGETITKEIKQELTYNELDKTIDNLWSVLFTTGYLTQRGRGSERKYKLVIPNREIKELFITQIQEWFHHVTKQDSPKLDKLCDAFWKKDAETIEKLLNDYLWNTISIRDTAVAKGKKENFYHGIILGLLNHKENWLVKSNVESGEGYSDILVEVPESRTGIVIEIKYAEENQLDIGCKIALEQIEEKQYATKLHNDGMQEIVKYGIACYKKYCKVVMGERM